MDQSISVFIAGSEFKKSNIGWETGHSLREKKNKVRGNEKQKFIKRNRMANFEPFSRALFFWADFILRIFNKTI